MSRVLVPVLAALAVAAPASAQLDQLPRGAPKTPSGAPALPSRALPLPAGPSEPKIGAALKEALQMGTDNAVMLTGQTDGYFANPAIRIPLPDNLRPLEKGLRAVGQGQQVDDFVRSMNRAAERAAPAARQIFWDAIVAMPFDDARRILAGSDTAATEYFKAKTTDRLTAAFRPVVEQAMNETAATRQYKELVGQAHAIPLAKLDSFDLDRYVVGKALNGLFHVVSEEERKIRKDPAARTTDLLREVFAQR
jgi:uncharacterized protein DUF4197